MSNKTREIRVRYIQSLMQPTPVKDTRLTMLSSTPAVPGNRVLAKPLTGCTAPSRRDGTRIDA